MILRNRAGNIQYGFFTLILPDNKLVFSPLESLFDIEA